MKISIGFSRPKRDTLFSLGIRWVDGTPYSHTYIKLFSSDFNRNVVFQASGTAVNIVSYDGFVADHIITDEISFEIKDIESFILKEFIIDTLGKPYSVSQIVYIAWLRLLKLLHIPVKPSKINGGNAYVCSELVLTALEITDLIESTSNLDSVSPGDVYKLVTSLKFH